MALSAKRSKSLQLSRKRRPRSGSMSTEGPLRQVALAKVKNDLSHFLHLAETEAIVITRHGKPAGVLMGFKDEEDWFDYRLEHDSGFLRRVAEARKDLRDGRGVRLENLPE